MKHRIIGDAIQTVALELEAGESVYSRQGSLLFARGAIKSLPVPSGIYWQALSEFLVKQNEAPLIVYSSESGGGLIGLQTPSPGRVHILHLSGAVRITISRLSLLAAADGVLVDPVRFDIGTTDSILPFVTLSGSGSAFLHGQGNLIEFMLASGEQIVVDRRSIVSFDEEVDFSIKAGESLPSGNFIVYLTGPGRIVLQTLITGEHLNVPVTRNTEIC